MTSTFKKHVLSSSAAHTSSASNLTRTSISSKLDNKNISTNQNKNNTSNKYDIHSCATPRKKNYSVQSTSSSPRLTLLNTTLPVAPVELNKTKQLTKSGKEYFCFRINSKSPHASQCVKSRILNETIDYILSIETFEKLFFVIKCIL